MIEARFGHLQFQTEVVRVPKELCQLNPQWKVMTQKMQNTDEVSQLKKGQSLEIK